MSICLLLHILKCCERKSKFFEEKNENLFSINFFQDSRGRYTSEKAAVNPSKNLRVILRRVQKQKYSPQC